MSIDPGFIDELERFAQSRDQRVTSRYQGEQRTRERGEGLTFADYRRYAPGDDTRRIDWKLFARTDELYVTEYEAERNRTLHVLLDSSGSMGFAGAGAPPQFELAAKLGIGYAYLAARAHDTFRFAVFDDRPERLDRGRSTRGEVLGLVDDLGAREPAGEGAFDDALEAYADRIDDRSLVLVLSDCLAPAAAVEARSYWSERWTPSSATSRSVVTWSSRTRRRRPRSEPTSVPAVAIRTGPDSGATSRTSPTAHAGWVSTTSSRSRMPTSSRRSGRSGGPEVSQPRRPRRCTPSAPTPFAAPPRAAVPA